MDSDELEKERYRVINETPTIQRATRDLNETSDTAFKENNLSLRKRDGATEKRDGKRQDATEGAIVAANNSEHTSGTSQNSGRNKNNVEEPRLGEEIVTPNLERVKAFFKKSSANKLGSGIKIASSPDDTPQSQRLKSDPAARETPSGAIIQRLKDDQQKRFNRSEFDFTTSEGNTLNKAHNIGSSPSVHYKTDAISPLSAANTSARFLSGTPLAHKNMLLQLETPQINSTSSEVKNGFVPRVGQIKGDIEIPATVASALKGEKKTVDTKPVHANGEEPLPSPGGLSEGPTSQLFPTMDISTQPIHIEGDRSFPDTRFEGSETQVDVTFPIPSLTNGEQSRDNIESPLVARFGTQKFTPAHWLSPEKDTQTQLVLSSQNVTPSSKERLSPGSKIRLGLPQNMSKLNEQGKCSSIGRGEGSPEIHSESSISTLSDSRVEEVDSEKRIKLRFSNVYEHNNETNTASDEDAFDEKVVYSDGENTQELPEVEDGFATEARNTGHKDSSIPSQKYRFQLSSTQELSIEPKNISQISLEESQEIVKNRRHLRWRRNNKLHPVKLVETADQDFPSIEGSPPNKLRKLTTCNDTEADNQEFSKKERVKEQKTMEEKKLSNFERWGSDTKSESQEHSPLPCNKIMLDGAFLTKKDLLFDDAVWCHYDFNYIYYPGKVRGYNPSTKFVEVLFESGVSNFKEEDIHYLDLMVGEIVIWDSKQYTVVALSRQSSDPCAIRCIRGYDTVHLKKRNKNGELGKRTLIKPISSVTLTVDLWAKRPKIILSSEHQDRAHAFEDLRHPIRGRKNTTLVTPVTPSCEMTGLPQEREHLERNNFSHPHLEREPNSADDLQKTAANQSTEKIFEKCLFILTGISDRRRRKLSSMIKGEGGAISKTCFSSILEFEASGKIKSDIFDLSSLRFVCLITSKHSRSLKYLETLALGLPTLHYKFLEYCVYRKTLDIQSIFQFLLPSGESSRLLLDSSLKSGAIKSNNIFHFYSKLISGASIEDQLNSRLPKMQEYDVIICGSSELDEFIHFIFHALGVRSVKALNFDFRENVFSTTEGPDDISSLVSKVSNHLEDAHRKLSKGLNILAYINLMDGKDGTSQHLTQNLKSLFDSKENIHIEEKEWLIQTVINENTGHWA
ncbi:chromatin-binding protein RAD9 [Lachancea thermotolerans CBS 6340]|uniref:KLTH0E09944p n=1 Tax=Lachancea thermotolerans (strain ATCC 56472 / CBS 6340 / NRRL Y-8284) TaxID=559295 RepID=C5DI60_LACTC|nr:KLTH0E09944p [Lachancea thermotolerans CBS 6340]CAR23471.1 KLTH0E09944p [Lachancea thermotolerans CBS 6340]